MVAGACLLPAWVYMSGKLDSGVQVGFKPRIWTLQVASSAAPNSAYGEVLCASLMYRQGIWTPGNELMLREIPQDTTGEQFFHPRTACIARVFNPCCARPSAFPHMVCPMTQIFDILWKGKKLLKIAPKKSPANEDESWLQNSYKVSRKSLYHSQQCCWCAELFARGTSWVVSWPRLSTPRQISLKALVPVLLALMLSCTPFSTVTPFPAPGFVTFGVLYLLNRHCSNNPCPC